MKKYIYTVLISLFGLASYAQLGSWESSIEKTFAEAKELYSKHLYNPAKTRFNEVINSNPPTKHTRVLEESYYHRAMCALFLMNKDAEELLEEFVLLYPASPYEQKAAFIAADYYFNKRSYRKAKEWFNKIDRKDLKGEEKSEYYFKLGYAQLKSGEDENAELSFYTVKEQENNYGASAKYYYAHMAYEKNNYVTALENFEPLLDNESFGPVVPYYLAQIYYKKEDFDKLIEYGEPLLARATQSRKPEIARLLGEAYLTKKDYKQAAKYLEYYRDNGGAMHREENYSLGFSYYKIQQYENAIQAFNKIAGATNDLGQNAYYHLADCYLKTGNKQEALSAFKAATESGENARIKEDAMFNYAKLNYELASPYGNAIKAFQDFLNEYPNTVKKSDANRYLANLYLTTKDYENALEAISNTGLKSNDMQEAYQKVSYFRGVQLFNSVQFKPAFQLFDQSLKFKINPTYTALAHFWKAEILYKEKNYKQSLVELNSFESTPGSYSISEFADARYSKAYCYFMLQDYANAITSFRLYKENKNAQPKKIKDCDLRLGDASFMLSKYGSAVKSYSQYLSYNPTDADYALFQKALCQGLNGQRSEKISTLNKLVTEYPQSKYAVSGKYEQGATYLLMDKNEEALTVFKDFVQSYPQSKHTRRAWLNIGVIYRNTNQNEQAISTFKKVVAEYPATPEAMEAIAFNRLIYSELNRVNEYVEWVEGVGFADIKRASLDSTMYSAAFDFYSAGDCKETMTAMDSYVNKFPDGIFMVPANFYLGECAYKANLDEKAEAALERVINEPRSEFTERSISMLATINYASKDYARALYFYEQLLDFSEETSELAKARIGAMRCAVALDNPQKALKFAEIILTDERLESEIESEARVVRARCYWTLEELSNAHQAYEEVKQKTKGESQAEAAYFISKIQNINSEYDKSNETIFWMIDNLPSYQKWRFKALLVMANNYLNLEDVFQANYTLDFIIEENYDAEIVAEAQALKDQIKQMQEEERNELEKREEQMNEEIIEIDESSEAMEEQEELENEGERKE